MNWIADLDEQSSRFSENASGVVKGLGADRIYHMNFLIDISQMCDCMPRTPYLMAPDIGILAGKDPVAIDQASMDYINNAPVPVGCPISELKPGDDKFALAHSKIVDGKVKLATNHISQINQAVKMGLGTTKYSIKILDFIS